MIEDLGCQYEVCEMLHNIPPKEVMRGCDGYVEIMCSQDMIKEYEEKILLTRPSAKKVFRIPFPLGDGRIPVLFTYFYSEDFNSLNDSLQAMFVTTQ